MFGSHLTIVRVLKFRQDEFDDLTPFRRLCVGAARWGSLLRPTFNYEKVRLVREASPVPVEHPFRYRPLLRLFIGASKVGVFQEAAKRAFGYCSL